MGEKLKNFNPQVFLEFLTYILFSVLIFYLVITERYLGYVTPRMKPYLYFAAVVVGIWGIFSLRRLFKPQYKIRTMHCFVLVFPMMMILLPHTTLGVSDFTGNYVSGGSSYPNKTDTSEEYRGIYEDSLRDKYSATEIGNSNTEEVELLGLDEANKEIVIQNEDFWKWTSEIYENMNRYEGHTVTMTGFVLKDPTVLKRNEFVPARLVMTCCIADLTPFGIIAQYEETPELKPESWVTVKGELFVYDEEQSEGLYREPRLKVLEIQETQPVEGYIYPF